MKVSLPRQESVACIHAAIGWRKPVARAGPVPGEALERIPDEDLLIYAQECLRGGFTKGAAVRAHLSQQLEAEVEVPPLVRGLLQMYLVVDGSSWKPLIPPSFPGFTWIWLR